LGQDILVSRVLSYSARLVERASPVSSLGVLKRDNVGLVTSVVKLTGRAIVRARRSGLIEGRGRSWGQRLMGVLGIGWSRCARWALARIIHGKDG
jgi:hypothetical protein